VLVAGLLFALAGLAFGAYGALSLKAADQMLKDVRA